MRLHSLLDRRFARALAVALTVGTVAPALAGPDFGTDDRVGPHAASDTTTPQKPSDEITFARDAAVLDASALQLLAAVRQWLAAHPADHLVLEGYADSTGPEDHNAGLATRRAHIVRNPLVAGGVAADRVVIAVYGENGAHQRPDPHDRRVVIYASAAPVAQLVSGELDHAAREVIWTDRGTRLRETRGITPVNRGGRG